MRSRQSPSRIKVCACSTLHVFDKTSYIGRAEDFKTITHLDYLKQMQYVRSFINQLELKFTRRSCLSEFYNVMNLK